MGIILSLIIQRKFEEQRKMKKKKKNDLQIGERKLKRVFNEVFLDNLKKSEIRSLKKKKKELADSYKKRMEENEKK